MPLTINKRVTVEQIFTEIDDLEIEALDAINCESELGQKLAEAVVQLTSRCRQVAKFAGQFDFTDVQANGYWSCLFLALKLIKFGIERLDRYDPNADFNVQFLMSMDVFLAAYSAIKDMKDYSDSESPKNILQGNLEMTALHFCKIVTTDYDHGWRPFMDQFAGYYLNSVTRLIVKGMFTIIPLMGAKIGDLFRCISDSDFRRRLLISMALRFDSTAVKFLASFGETNYHTKYMPIQWHFFQPNIKKTINVPRQRKWIIDYSADGEVFIRKDCPGFLWGNEPVRCRYLHKTNGEKFANDTIIIHCHGGGFVTGTPDAHEIYTRGWARDLPGVPIVSIDYSLSPEAKFPIASQQILDVYLWLTSNGDDVLELVGFRPTKVILVGDSSGGLLLTSTTVILNDIRKMWPIDGQSIRMPKAIVGFYSSFTIAGLMTPSFVTACVHPFLFPSVFVSMVKAYLPDGQKPGLDNCGNIIPANEEIKDDQEIHDWPFFSAIKQFFANAYENVTFRWRMYLSLFSESDDLWYMKSENFVIDELRSDSKFTQHPYLSPLNYDDFESLKDVSMHLVSMPFEPILDHSVMMAGKWKGEVTLDILEDVIHGFLNMIPFKGVYTETYEFSVTKLKRAIVS